MARLMGVDLPRDKRMEIALTYIYGIGLTTSKKILAETGVDPDVRIKDLTEDDLTKLRDYIQENIKVEGDLHREVSQNVKRLMEGKCPATQLWLWGGATAANQLEGNFDAGGKGLSIQDVMPRGIVFHAAAKSSWPTTASARPTSASTERQP